jgi:predicted metalloprotease with PDZ domain
VEIVSTNTLVWKEKMKRDSVLDSSEHVRSKMHRPGLLRLLAWTAVLVVLGMGTGARAQSQTFRIDYTVKVASIDEHLFHVTADIQNISQPVLDLSLPKWTPGWYTIENYGKNLIRLEVKDANKNVLPHTMTRSQTWRIKTAGLTRLLVDFDYYADVLALNQAKITPEFAFFTGTEIFLMAEGHRNSPSNVTLDIPKGWKVASALESTPDPNVLAAPDYDTLVDSPTEMGHFDVTSFEVEGKPHYLVVTPAGSFSKEYSERFCSMLTEVAHADSIMFGGLPYSKYTYFYFFAPAESNASGALEHLSSHVAFAPPAGLATPERMASTAAHEYFHLWNVKRIRPAEMWPYDYSREDETPLLWVSEGFTNYYGNISRYRAGLIDQRQFIKTVAEAINGVENNEARAYISPAESSVSTWLGYDNPVQFSISYYTQGQNLGALLDLSILHDTAAARGLDDVMKALYRDFYQRGKGFSTEDLIGVINRLAGRDYHDFFSKYVDGVDVPPYDTILGYAGYKLDKTSTTVASLGILVRPSGVAAEITRVRQGTQAEAAGLQVGDVLLTIDGMPVRRGLAPVSSRLSEKIGQSVAVEIRREGVNKTIQMKVDGRGLSGHSVEEVQNPTPDQLRVRDAWLKKSK